LIPRSINIRPINSPFTIKLKRRGVQISFSYRCSEKIAITERASVKIAVVDIGANELTIFKATIFKYYILYFLMREKAFDE
tara:strand:- start:27795 stop:28037 length:243 start_codon:yes stop_codon:yes gene_type:complete